MAKYNIEAYCFDHAGTIEETVSSLKALDNKLNELKKTALQQLGVSSEGSAIIQAYKVKASKGTSGFVKGFRLFFENGSVSSSVLKRPK